MDIELRTLGDGGQTADAIADELIAFLAAAHTSLDLALYDIRLPGPVGDHVREALVAAAGRGVAVRLAYNVDHPGSHEIVAPPPPKTEPSLIESLPLPTKAIPGTPDLMHHKYVIRDGEAVWSGSTNWTLDSWTREENALVRVTSPDVACDFATNFGEIWGSGHVQDSGSTPTRAVQVGGATVRAWFSPGQGPALSQRVADAIAGAQRRVRIASPVITTAPVLRALAARDGDVTGVVDATQISQVLYQWSRNPHATWKGPLLQQALAKHEFHGKHSTPYAPGSVHDYMHAKVTVCDDTLFVGSFNLSRSGEQNAENVLEIADAALAERVAGFIDSVRALYPVVS